MLWNPGPRRDKGDVCAGAEKAAGRENARVGTSVPARRRQRGREGAGEDSVRRTACLPHRQDLLCSQAEPLIRQHPWGTGRGIGAQGEVHLLPFPHRDPGPEARSSLFTRGRLLAIQEPIGIPGSSSPLLEEGGQAVSHVLQSLIVSLLLPRQPHSPRATPSLSQCNSP